MNYISTDPVRLLSGDTRHDNDRFSAEPVHRDARKRPQQGRRELSLQGADGATLKEPKITLSRTYPN
jgi:hypothetical protein